MLSRIAASRPILACWQRQALVTLIKSKAPTRVLSNHRSAATLGPHALPSLPSAACASRPSPPAGRDAFRAGSLAPGPPTRTDAFPAAVARPRSQSPLPPSHHPGPDPAAQPSPDRRHRPALAGSRQSHRHSRAALTPPTAILAAMFRLLHPDPSRDRRSLEMTHDVGWPVS